MNQTSHRAQQDVNANYQQLLSSQKTLLLSTTSKLGKPECSYAPFVRDEAGIMYIFVSNLATHTRNMLDTLLVSVMFIQSENQSSNLFARERVIFDCTIQEIPRSDTQFPEIMSAMKDALGETIDLLMSLADFHLLALVPEKGRYVAGFGKAFPLDLKNGVVIEQANQS